MEPDRNCPDNDYNWIGLPRYNPKYKKGIQSFMESAFPLFSVGDEMNCPCKDCNDRKWHLRDGIYDHLICRGPSLLHVHWIYETIDEVLREGGDADAVLPDGKHGPDWLVGRQGSLLALENTHAIPQPSADELTAKITRDLESQMEAKVNKKVQENMTWFLKKLGEANPTLKFDIGDFCATFSSDQDKCDTPITQTPGGATS
ncbi:hypothetical protein OROMI_021755 [Orobanche minor]